MAIRALLGGGLIFRGITGHSFLYQALGINTLHHSEALTELPDNQGILLRRAVTIDAPQEKLYGIWKDYHSLPQFLNGLQSVPQTSNGNLHWEL